MALSTQQALECFASDDLIGIGMEADAVRQALHPEEVVTYSIEGCVSFTQELPSLFAAVADTLAEGTTGVALVGCPPGSLLQVEDSMSGIKTRFPQVQLHSFSAADVLGFAAAADLPVGEVLSRLGAAGLDMLTGDGADPLQPAPWLDVHRAAHRAGIASTASITFGGGESAAERVAFLTAIHALQQETHGFRAFSVFSAHAATGRDLDDPTAVEYLKTLAICRIMLDNIPHLQGNWQQQGLKVLQMCLRFGADDIGSILGHGVEASEEEIRRIIRDAGFRPAQRDTLYRFHFLN